MKCWERAKGDSSYSRFGERTAFAQLQVEIGNLLIFAIAALLIVVALGAKATVLNCASQSKNQYNQAERRK
jgi:hypothetical protein